MFFPVGRLRLLKEEDMVLMWDDVSVEEDIPSRTDPKYRIRGF